LHFPSSQGEHQTSLVSSRRAEPQKHSTAEDAGPKHFLTTTGKKTQTPEKKNQQTNTMGYQTHQASIS